MYNFKRNISTGKKIQYGYYQFLDHLIGREKSFQLHKKSRRKLFSNLHLELKKSGLGIQKPVDRVKNLSYSEFKKKYLQPGVPVIFDGKAKNWPCVKTWTFEYFKELYGNDIIAIFDDKGVGNEYVELTLSEIINDINNGVDRYARFYPLLERHPERINDFDYKWLQKHSNKWKPFEAFQVFIGGDKSFSPLHNANQSNLFVQVYGEKQWVLYPHYYTPIIDPDPIRNVYRSAPNRQENSAFNPFNTDIEPPKLYKYIDSYSVHLYPGDILWNPPYWWHAVKNKGKSIGVGYRWVSPFYTFNQNPLYTFLDLFAMNPPVWKAYKRYKKTPDQVLLDDWKETRLGEKVEKKEYIHKTA